MAMKDYMTNSPFGQVAGALLAKKDDDYKKNMAIAFGAGFLKDFLSNLTAFQQEERLGKRKSGAWKLRDQLKSYDPKPENQICRK